MKIVIDIPEDRYETLKMLSETRTFYLDFYQRLIVNGTPLPKGHGRLVDENDLVKDFNTFQDAFMINMAKDRFRIVCTAKTVIEADKEGAEE